MKEFLNVTFGGTFSALGSGTHQDHIKVAPVPVSLGDPKGSPAYGITEVRKEIDKQGDCISFRMGI